MKNDFVTKVIATVQNAKKEMQFLNLQGVHKKIHFNG